MEYTSEVLRRFGAARRAREFTVGAGKLVSGEAEDRSLGVWVRFDVQVTGGIVGAVCFQVYGCPHTVAAASWVAEWLEGRPADAMRALDVHGLRAALDIPVEKLGKLLRIEDALAACWRALPSEDGA